MAEQRNSDQRGFIFYGPLMGLFNSALLNVV